MNKTFIKAALVRAIKTFFQSFVGFSAGAVILTDVDWLYVASGSTLAMIVSLATSIAGLPEVKCEEEKEVA